MFMCLILLPFSLLLGYILPFIGTIYSVQRNSRWSTFWLITVLQYLLLQPVLEMIFQCQTIMFINIVVSLLKLILISEERSNTIIGLTDQVIERVLQQYAVVKNKVSELAKQHEICN